ncbi:DMT family transporter [Nocardiopsis halophila]|uniref:DMT family transporter n=1 Tax=Nocardiopsis halophila TaxID=141692 RepID=UPI00034DF41B|nr:multidrug efflux SMR transporter [Nocardiopsis halophila]
MPWIILLISAVFEAVWATAMGMSEGFTEPGPTAVFAVALLASMVGLGRAVKHIPIGTGYAVWVGVGAALTVAYAMATGAEPVSAAKIVFIGGIILAVAGLKLVPGGPEPLPGAAAEQDAGG